MRYLFHTLFIVLLLASCNTKKQPVFKTNTGFALGTTYTIKYQVASKASDYQKEIDAVFKTINRSLSTYIPTSDISKINAGDSTIVTDSYFQEVLKTSKEIWKNTNAYFDPTVGALVNAWGFGPEKSIPVINPEQIDSILAFTGLDKISLHTDFTIKKKDKRTSLDFNAIAKGYTIDVLSRMLTAKGVKNYLIEVGGEIITKGKNTNTNKPWVVAIENPLQDKGQRTLLEKIALQNKAMATSGNYRKYRVDPQTGMYYVHTINPKTGYTQKTNILSVSVLAPTCMQADAYATAFMVMPIEETKKLVEQLKDIDVYVVTATKQNTLDTFISEGFKSVLLP